MANSAYTSGFNTDALFVPAKAATVYAAHEQSLFLSGQLIPVVSAPNGVLQVPQLAAVSATVLSAEAAPGVDLETVLPTDTKNTIQADLYAARSVVRDLGNIDPQEIGRTLGNAVSKAFDEAVYAAVGAKVGAGLTPQEITDSAGLTVDEIAKAVAAIRGGAETGPLYGIISTNAYAALMADIGGNAFAGGEMFQGEALRSGYFGKIMGVDLFVSSYLNDTSTTETNTKALIFGKDAMRIAMQKNVDLEVARRAEAVGVDVVASLHAGVGVIDTARMALLVDQV